MRLFVKIICFLLIMFLWQSQAALFGQEELLDEWLSLYLEDEELLAEEEALIIEAIITMNEAEALIEKDDFSFIDDFFYDDDFILFDGPPLLKEALPFETRSFDDLFPNISPMQKRFAMNNYGLRFYFSAGEPANLVPNPDLGIDILSIAMERKPSHLIEALIVVPYENREYDLIDIYNALGRISNLKDYPVPLGGSDFYVFTDSSRIISSRNRRNMPDAPLQDNIPIAETIYIRLKENSFGDLFIRGEITTTVYGLTYNMTNFADVRYIIVPVMRAERFSTIIYLEPVKEGVLIYSVVGFYLPNFIADRVNLTPSINRRITVFTNWIVDGLKKQEILRPRPEPLLETEPEPED